jgi:hypothetical protein
MKLSDIIFSYRPQSAEALDKPFRVLGDPLVRVIDRRLSHTAVGKAKDGEKGETTYYYYVLVCGSDSFDTAANIEWHPEERVWEDIKDFYVPLLR